MDRHPSSSISFQSSPLLDRLPPHLNTQCFIFLRNEKRHRLELRNVPLASWDIWSELQLVVRTLRELMVGNDFDLEVGILAILIARLLNNYSVFLKLSLCPQNHKCVKQTDKNFSFKVTQVSMIHSLAKSNIFILFQFWHPVS